LRQESTLKYEYGGHEADELKTSQNNIDILACNMETMVLKTKEMIAALESKIEGLRGQQTLFNTINTNSALQSSFKLNPEFTKKMSEAHGQTEEQVRRYQQCLKDYFLFHFQDLQLDLLNASATIKERFDKEEQIKANVQKLQDFELEAYWEQHKIIVQQMNHEAKLFRQQAVEAMYNLLNLHNKVKNVHYKDVSSDNIRSR
jgi:hypothetical protein